MINVCACLRCMVHTIASAGRLPHNCNHVWHSELDVSSADHRPVQFRTVFQILERQLCNALALALQLIREPQILAGG